jgi:hypothetical protein
MLFDVSSKFDFAQLCKQITNVLLNVITLASSKPDNNKPVITLTKETFLVIGCSSAQ